LNDRKFKNVLTKLFVKYILEEASPDTTIGLIENKSLFIVGNELSSYKNKEQSVPLCSGQILELTYNIQNNCANVNAWKAENNEAIVSKLGEVMYLKCIDYILIYVFKLLLNISSIYCFIHCSG